MNNAKVGDIVLVTMRGVLGDRKIGKVVDIHSKFVANIEVAFRAPSYKIFYNADELKVITMETDPEYFI
jgi:hypothetical protein